MLPFRKFFSTIFSLIIIATVLYSASFSTVYAQTSGESGSGSSSNNGNLKNYLLSNPTKDSEFQKGIINPGLPTVNSDNIATPAGDIPYAKGVLAGQSIIGWIILSLLKLIGAFALGGVGVNIFILLFSAGNEEKIKKAKKGILFSLVGLILALLAHAFITAVVQYLLRA